MDRIAGILLEREVLDRSEFDVLMEGGELPPRSAKKAEDSKPAADGDAKAPDDAPEKERDLTPPLPENRVDGLPKDGLLG